jgi:hypothetical protein
VDVKDNREELTRTCSSSDSTPLAASKSGTGSLSRREMIEAGDEGGLGASPKLGPYHVTTM